MTKFFRNIRRKLISEKRVSKYLLYAIGEIILVVIGILIALSINTWNENRKNSLLELQYLKRLENDLLESIKRTTLYRDFQVATADSLVAVIEDLKACEIPVADRHKFANGLYHIGKFAPPVLIDGTIRELQSTGNLLIIGNVKLREQLTQLLGEFQSKLILMPYANTRMLHALTYIEELVTFNVEYSRMGMMEVNFEDMNFDMAEICADKKFLSAVIAIRTQTYEVAEWNKMSLVEFEAFLLLIQEEIDKLEGNNRS